MYTLLRIWCHRFLIKLVDTPQFLWNTHSVNNLCSHCEKFHLYFATRLVLPSNHYRFYFTFLTAYVLRMFWCTNYIYVVTWKNSALLKLGLNREYFYFYLSLIKNNALMNLTGRWAIKHHQRLVLICAVVYLTTNVIKIIGDPVNINGVRELRHQNICSRLNPIALKYVLVHLNMSMILEK